MDSKITIKDMTAEEYRDAYAEHAGTDDIEIHYFENGRFDFVSKDGKCATDADAPEYIIRQPWSYSREDIENGEGLLRDYARVDGDDNWLYELI